MKRMLFLVMALCLGACDDDTTAPAVTADLASCAPLVTGRSDCPPCAPATSGFCGTERENIQCQFAGSDYCTCHGGLWSCSSQPFPAPPDLAPPRD